MMNVIVWLVVGGVLGWLASLVMKTDNQQGLLLNVVVGIAGAVLAGWVIAPLVGRRRMRLHIRVVCNDSRSCGAGRARSFSA